MTTGQRNVSITQGTNTMSRAHPHPPVAPCSRCTAELLCDPCNYIVMQREMLEIYRRTMFSMNYKVATEWPVSQDYFVGMTGMCIEQAENITEQFHTEDNIPTKQ